MNEIIRFNSTDKDIAAVKCYVSKSMNGSPLYRDEAKTEIIPKEEAIDLFNKGLITVAYGHDFLMNCKPTFIIDDSTAGVEIDEEAGYGVVFFIGNDDGTSNDGEVVTCYVDSRLNGSPLYRDSELHEIVPKEEAIELFNKGLVTVDYGGSDSGFMNCKPIFITDMEIQDVEFVDGAEYGVIFYIPSNSGITELYMSKGQGSEPMGPLYSDHNLDNMVPFNEAVDFVRNGNAVVYVYDAGHMMFAGKPTCVVKDSFNGDYYNVKF